MNAGGWALNIQELTYELAKDFGLDEPRGALVKRVLEGTPAEKAGIKRGDVILEVDQTPIRDTAHLVHVVAAIEVGKEVDVRISRRGKEKSLKIALGKRPPRPEREAIARGEPVPSSTDEMAFAGMPRTGING